MATSSDGSPDETAELDIEDLGLDLDLGDSTGEVLAGLAAAGDEPEVDLNFDTLQSDTGLDEQPAEGTAELPAPEGAELESLTEQMERVEEEAGDLTEVVESVQDETQMAPFAAPTEKLETLDEDDPTLGELESAVASDEHGTTPEMTSLTEILEATASIGDDEGTVVAQTIQMPAAPAPEEENTDYTAQMDEGDFASQRLTAVIEQPDLDDDDTAQVEAVEEDDDPSLDLNDITAALGADLEETAELPRAGEEPDSTALMDEIFGDDEQTRLAPGLDVIAGDDPSVKREEPVQPTQVDVTLDEVGTKLDLARAYIDMGDPDGAKSILEEVMSEGDERQKDEAQQLMDGVT
jgi:pilus assembly protein FimV